MSGGSIFGVHFAFAGLDFSNGGVNLPGETEADKASTLNPIP